MGLIELCLLSVLTPQQPGAPDAANPAPAASPAAAVEAGAQDPAPAARPDAADGDPAARLRAAEQAGEHADTAELVALATGEDAQVAARAAWLLANSANPEHARALAGVAADSPHADARVHAMRHVLKTAQAPAAALAIARLGDDDRRVRTLAVQVLGKLRNPMAIGPLVALVDDRAGDGAPGAPTDVQAALLALSDFGAGDQLLRVSTSIHDSSVAGAGEALTFAFQTLSPKLEQQDEITLLISALGHREAMVRRYAITRLAELGDASAVSALEGRLAAEGVELRPLVENALAQLRRDKGDQPTDELERAKANAKVLWARITTWWSGLEPLHQGMVAGAPALLIVLLMMMRRGARRRAARAEGLAAAAMVAPSDDYYEDEYDEGEEYDEHAAEYEDEEEYEDGDYDDEQAADHDEQADEYDTSGWDEGDEDETLLAEGGLEDERFR